MKLIKHYGKQIKLNIEETILQKEKE